MIASLPMYWRAETAALWRRFWGDVQNSADVDLPDLTPPEALPADWTDHWRDPALTLSMTCSLPLRTTLRDKVTYVGTLGFGLRCKAGHYYSRILLRPGARRPWRLAYNSHDSQSGWAVTQHPAPFREPPVFQDVIETGSHEGSVRALIEGRADVAYIDAVSWRLLKRALPEANALELGGRSVVTPALPLITAKANDPCPLRAALRDAIIAFDPPDPMAMGGPLSFTVLDEADYFDQPLPQPPTL